MCIYNLQKLDGKTSKTIILITDGDENEKPFINETQEKLLESKITLITVALGYVGSSYSSVVS